MERTTVYFDKPGKDNTDDVLKLINARAKELGIKTVLISSTTGFAGARAVEALQGLRVVVISHATGMREPNLQSLTDENRNTIISKGGVIHTATHVFSGINRAFHRSTGQGMPAFHYVMGDMVAESLRTFGQGTKVCCEISCMAADAGLVRTDEDIIAAGGTGAGGRGLDTSWVIQPANSFRLFEMRVKELICKPRL